MKPWHEHFDLATRQRMEKAMLAAMAMGRHESADFDSPPFACAWEYLHYFRGAGKTSAYGPQEHAAMTDANSHALRGFIVGWAMHEALAEKFRETAARTVLDLGALELERCTDTLTVLAVPKAEYYDALLPAYHATAPVIATR